MSYDPEPTQPSFTPPPGFAAAPEIATERNDGDNWALIAITVAAMTLLSCVPGLNCIAPLAPLIAGIVALSKAKSASNPQQAKTFGWIATILGILVLLAAVAIIILYGAIIAGAIQDAQRNGDF